LEADNLSINLAAATYSLCDCGNLSSQLPCGFVLEIKEDDVDVKEKDLAPIEFIYSCRK
jgi:hypothetical protein